MDNPENLGFAATALSAVYRLFALSKRDKPKPVGQSSSPESVVVTGNNGETVVHVVQHHHHYYNATTSSSPVDRIQG